MSTPIICLSLIPFGIIHTVISEFCCKEHIMPEQAPKTPSKNLVFSGHIYLFHAFDVGDDINLEKVKACEGVINRPYSPPKYFKNYHIPLAVELPHPHESARCFSVKIYNFGAISLTYKIPFNDTLQNIAKKLPEIDNQFLEQSVSDVGSLFKEIKQCISKPSFFHTRSSYLLLQVDPQPEKINTPTLKKEYGGPIASALRLETERLSEYQKNEILESAVGYFRGDFIVIDTESAFVYDQSPEELIDLFEFANIQQLELRYFDRLLDQKMNLIYEEKSTNIPIKSYLPFWGTFSKGLVDELSRLRVDISVITERLESSIRLVGEPYFSELYELLTDKLELRILKATIDKKLSIVQNMQNVIQSKIDSIREDLLTTSIIVLIIIEAVIGALK